MIWASGPGGPPPNPGPTLSSGGWRVSGAPIPRPEHAADEARDHHPVLTALPRADRVEEAHDHAVEPALVVRGKREELVDRLRLGVQPALLGRRSVHAPVALGKRPLLAVIAVDLG